MRAGLLLGLGMLAAGTAMGGWSHGRCGSIAGAGEAAPFAWIEIWIDSGDRPLSAWQAELRLLAPGARIAGIEGGEPTAFRDPPYYDPKALRAERAVLAAFSTAEEAALPRGRFRVATVHVEVPDGAIPAAQLVLETAAGPEGLEIEVVATAIPGR